MNSTQAMRNSDMANFIVDEFQKPKQNQNYDYQPNYNNVESYDTDNTESYNSKEPN